MSNEKAFDASQTNGARSELGRNKLTSKQLAELRTNYQQVLETGNFDAAAAIGAEIADAIPEDQVAQRIASHAFIQAKQLENALDYALRAHQLAPGNISHRMHAGAVMNRLEDFSGAIMMLSPALQNLQRPAGLYHQIAVSAEQMNNSDLAVEMAATALDMEPKNHTHSMFLANIYARRGEWGRGIGILETAGINEPNNAVIKRTISGFFINLNDFENALLSIDAAIKVDPIRADFHIHRVGVLRRLGKLDDALKAIETVLELDPSNLNIRRNAVSVYTETGDFKKALQTSAHLLSIAPDVEEYASCMRFLLEAKSSEALKNEIGDIAALKRDGPKRVYQKPPTFSNQARSQVNVISALVLREIRARYGRNRLGFLWAIIGPFAHIGILAIVFSIGMDRNPPLGENYFFYYYTGVVPFLLLTQITNQCGHAVMGNRGLLQLPDITPTDLLVAKAIVELFTLAIVVVLFGIIFMSLNITGLPYEPGLVLMAFVLTWVLGLGLGAIYSTLLEFGKLVETVFTGLFRAMYFTSGIFFLPSSVPEGLRYWLYWNPFVHLVDLCRAGYYPFYDETMADPAYAAICSLFILTIGAVALRVVSDGMRSQK